MSPKKSLLFYLFILFIDGMAANPSLSGCAALSPLPDLPPLAESPPWPPPRASYSIRSDELVSALRLLLYHFRFYKIPLRLNLLQCGKPIWLVFVTPLISSLNLCRVGATTAV
jgi:hypothetical protein